MEILIAEISDEGEKKGTFMLAQALALLATFNNDSAFVEEHGKLTFADDDVLDGLFFDDGPLTHMFVPDWCDYEDGATFDTVLKNLSAGETVVIDSEETAHVLAVDTGKDGLKKELMQLVRQIWGRGRGAEDDNEGW